MRGISFTMAIRIVCGFVLGCLACLVFFWKGILKSASHDHPAGPLYLMLGCGVIGSIVTAVTVPDWQRPWYKSIRDRSRDDGA